MEAAKIEAVKVGPSLGERFRKQRSIETRYLRRFRENLEHGLEGVWTEVELPAVLLLADVCEALCLSEAQRRDVLGEAGWALVTETQVERFRIV